MAERQVVALKVAGSNPVTHPIFWLSELKMLKNSDQHSRTSHFGASAISVHGRRFNNSAAKFWTALLDELCAEYAGCRSVTLEALHEGRLEPEMLFPEIELERELSRSDLSLEGAGAAWQKALAELELYGPPGSVAMSMTLPSGGRERLVLPMDCVDAEIFLYLLAWLLEWGELPLSSWNEQSIRGAFAATDPARRLKYLFDFAIEHKPVREGLFSWRLDLKFQRGDSRRPAPAGDREDAKK